jgi:hypothetical protein
VVEDQVEDGAGAGDLANALSPPGLDPDAAFVGKAGNRVEAGFGRRVENGVTGERGEAFFLTVGLDFRGFELPHQSVASHRAAFALHDPPRYHPCSFLIGEDSKDLRGGTNSHES